MQTRTNGSIEEHHLQSTTSHPTTFSLSTYFEGTGACLKDFLEAAFLNSLTVAQFSQKEELSLLENRARVMNFKVVQGAGSWLNKLDELKTISKLSSQQREALEQALRSTTLTEGKKGALLQKALDLGDAKKSKAFVEDFIESPTKLQKLGERPELVEAWKVLDDAGETALRKDIGEEIHNATCGGFGHSGGAAIIDRGLQGLFGSPIF
ncbi:MAG: hypothetical protein SNJ77_04595 [Cytophagales bacterium]